MAAIDEMGLGAIAHAQVDEYQLRQLLREMVWRWILANKDRTALRIGPISFKWGNGWVLQVVTALVGPNPY